MLRWVGGALALHVDRLEQLGLHDRRREHDRLEQPLRRGHAAPVGVLQLRLQQRALALAQHHDLLGTQRAHGPLGVAAHAQAPQGQVGREPGGAAHCDAHAAAARGDHAAKGDELAADAAAAHLLVVVARAVGARHHAGDALALRRPPRLPQHFGHRGAAALARRGRAFLDWRTVGQRANAAQQLLHDRVRADVVALGDGCEQPLHERRGARPARVAALQHRVDAAQPTEVDLAVELEEGALQLRCPRGRPTARALLLHGNARVGRGLLFLGRRSIGGLGRAGSSRDGRRGGRSAALACTPLDLVELSFGVRVGCELRLLRQAQGDHLVGARARLALLLDCGCFALLAGLRVRRLVWRQIDAGRGLPRRHHDAHFAVLAKAGEHEHGGHGRDARHVRVELRAER